MSKGKAIVDIVRGPGLVGHETAGEYDFLYRASSVKDPKWDIGDRVALPDGRVYRYGLAVNSIEPGRGLKFSGNIASDGVSGNVNRAQAVGDKELRWASETFLKDELKGGYVIVFGGSNSYQQFGVIGNTACSASELTVYLDRAITTDVGSTQFAEILPNPYRYLKQEYNYYMSHAGVGMSYPTAGQYFWIQTWGPCWINNGPYGQGAETSERDVLFNGDGSLRNMAEWDVIVGNNKAGFIITATSNGNDAVSFIMLQINP
ncbi:hypothetical protein LCGC14_2940660 [marine sediment metagenome]|uniref:Uncharacterized protein n=1 Tax=marine sediment metagenome TaxID=412755 RepID=A0A0F8Y531_9ZZZZ